MFISDVTSLLLTSLAYKIKIEDQVELFAGNIAMGQSFGQKNSAQIQR